MTIKKQIADLADKFSTNGNYFVYGYIVETTSSIKTRNRNTEMNDLA